MICPTCNVSNAEGARFCSSCGAELGVRGARAAEAAREEEITRQQSIAKYQEVTLTDSGGDGLPGSEIAAKYRIEAKLGVGGMGTVYRATRLLIGDEVAIKILHSEQSDPRAAGRFRREAQAAARLKHPNAVTIHDFGVTDEGMQYLVMELVDGESLRHIIKQQGPLTPSAAVEIIDQVCAALEEAHRHNIIHRDIKPDNIMVNATTAGLRVKVLDFGIAKLRDDTTSNLTQTGSILGTPHYMSPEQCLGEELDSRSDIYSLGVVAYEMLTGLVPFNSPSSSGVVVQHVTQEPPPLLLLNPTLSPSVEFAVLNALEKRREARPQTAAVFAERLSSAIAGKTQTTSSDISNAEPIQLSQQGSSQTQPTVVVAKSSAASSSGLNREGGLMQRSPKRSFIGYIGVALGALVLGGVVVLFVRSGGGGNAGNSNAQKAPIPLNITATASSVRLPIQTYTYDAANVIDGRRNTAWVEGVNGPGIGEWIRLDFDREIVIHRMIVQPGYFKSPQIWKENNRVAAVTATFSDGSSRELTFSDQMEDQQIDVGLVKTKWVRFVIKSAYYGTNPGRYDDTALSEVTFEWEPKN